MVSANPFRLLFSFKITMAGRTCRWKWTEKTGSKGCRAITALSHFRPHSGDPIYGTPGREIQLDASRPSRQTGHDLSIPYLSAIRTLSFDGKRPEKLTAVTIRLW